MAARGGRRSGAPGKAYSNRTDLLVQRSGQVGTQTAASGGQVAPAQPQQPMVPAFQTPDMVPRLDDPTARPGEPVTHGLQYGPGGGVEALGAIPANPTVTSLQAAYLANPTPELRRALLYIQSRPGGI